MGLGCSTEGGEGLEGGGKDLRFCSLGICVVGTGELGTEEGDSICLLMGIGDCTTGDGGDALLVESVLALGRVAV